MCGINGIFAYHASASLPKEAELLATRDHMYRRGPDGVGAWWSHDHRIGFGHRRLSIIDLLERANQPMTDGSGRYTIVFNGEIYNYPELRRDLEAKGCVFRTTSDTEALLHLYALEGAAMVSRLRGMFAMGIWDRDAHSLFLARDPYGIKPLYIANDGWTLRFASQVKALLAGGHISREPEPAGLVGFYLWGSVPEPFTCYRDIRQLPAGHTQLIDTAGVHAPKPYISIASILAQTPSHTFSDPEIEARIQTAALDSVRAHLLADVEVGVFLSAGIDSGALLGLMRDAGQERIRAITLAFSEFVGTSEDETPLARQVATLYQAEHVVRTVDEAEFKRDLPEILETMDQPSIDGINTWFVSKAAKEAGLKVALSGLGGDELLAGYPSFRELPKWVKYLSVPAAIPGVGALGRAAFGLFKQVGVSPKLAGLLTYGGTFPGAYLLRRGLFLPFELRTILDPELLTEGMRRLNPLTRVAETCLPDPGSPMGRVSALESCNYMRNQLLRDSDWAGMAHSLEIRTPLVDRLLLEEVGPTLRSFGPGFGKQALAKAASTPLPDIITHRAKTGFGVPTGRWIANQQGSNISSKGEASRAWAMGLLASEAAAPNQQHSLNGALASVGQST
jgi:asparagine synthase (glutamine-hydrolysing)